MKGNILEGITKKKYYMYSKTPSKLLLTSEQAFSVTLLVSQVMQSINKYTEFAESITTPSNFLLHFQLSETSCALRFLLSSSHFFLDPLNFGGYCIFFGNRIENGYFSGDFQWAATLRFYALGSAGNPVCYGFRRRKLHCYDHYHGGCFVCCFNKTSRIKCLNSLVFPM